ncbi:hypothetical protein Tco_0827372 [Tanacetum coccineum]
MLLSMNDEARGKLNDEENAFMLDNHYGDDSLEELNAIVIIMARIQPTNDKANAETIYDADTFSEGIIPRMTKLSDENVLLKTQVESVVQERENIKIEFQEQFNSIKAIQVQHQQEVNELIEHVNQKTYAYVDVRAKNQDILITISELKAKLAAQAKNVNTKFDKSTTLEN